MQKPLTIGQLEKQTGVPAKTIRFYEEIGLLEKPQRAKNGYRVYNEKNIEELFLIKQVRELGLPIPEIKKLMIGCEGRDCKHTKSYLEKEIGEYVGRLEGKIHDLSSVKETLQILHGRILAEKKSADNQYCCDILSQIVSIKKGGATK